MDSFICEQMIDLFEKNPDKHESGKITDLYTKNQNIQDYKKKEVVIWNVGN